MSSNNSQPSLRSDIARVIRSIFFKAAVNSARTMAGKPGKALSVVALATARLAQNGNRSGFATLKENLWVLIDMVRAVIRREYSIPTASTVKALTGVIYFVFIIDAIPDFIPAAGFLDDLAVVGWVMRSIQEDIKKFSKYYYTGTAPEEISTSAEV